MIYAMLAAFGHKKLKNMVLKEDTSYHDTTVENKFHMLDEVSFKEAGFNLMFGLLSENSVLQEHEYAGYL